MNILNPYRYLPRLWCKKYFFSIKSDCHRAVSGHDFLCVIKKQKNMTMTQKFLNELEQEAKTTRKMLSIVPDDKLDWQPHPKSMTLRRLATHVAELPGWVAMAINTEGLDLA